MLLLLRNVLLLLLLLLCSGQRFLIVAAVNRFADLLIRRRSEPTRGLGLALSELAGLHE